MTRLAIVRGRYHVNRTSGGGRSYQKVKGFANYLAYGPRENGYYIGRQSRGTWYDQAMRPHSQAEVLAWAKEKVHHFGYDYTYQAMLSTRYGHLSPADFNQALERGAEASGLFEWRMMLHHDTANQHAHAIFFSHEKLTPATYREWQQALQAELQSAQQGYHLRLELAQEAEAQTPAEPGQAEAELAQQQEAERALQAELAQRELQAMQQIELSRGRGLELSL